MKPRVHGKCGVFIGGMDSFRFVKSTTAEFWLSPLWNAGLCVADFILTPNNSILNATIHDTPLSMNSTTIAR